MTITNIKLITNGIVRNLLKTPYYLRIPADPNRRDRLGKNIVIPATEDVEIDYRDWKLVEFDLITKDKINILRIIRYPSSAAGVIIINDYHELPPTPTEGTLVWAQYGPYQGLYYWDAVRNEWLSDNEIIHTWNSAADVNTHTLNLMHHTNDTQADNDVNVSIPLTITGMAVSQVNPIATGNVTRFAINTFDLTTEVKTPEVSYIDLNVVGARGASSTTLNSPINAGVVLSASRIKLAGTDKITRPAATLWYRWRLVP